ncbi:pyroglutamyl-peptidase I [Fundicoccus sp. Sow4_H7]|uniref:pyroglutamyl-peptidase I n=1 Tax=Fundicoccus sp. Sow4_H7 TaxID=3438784 RepID=UPI003F8FBD63
MKILLTAFDPFGGEAINPSLEAIKQIGDVIGNAQIIKLELPTVFDLSAEKLSQAIKEHQPDVVLSIGQAGGRAGISLERVAINIDDARIPDNLNNQPIDEAIQANGSPAYFSRLPIKAIVEKLKQENIPAFVSNSAGTFVCNHIMYQALYLAHTQYPTLKAGFMHIPYQTEQVIDKADTPSMELADIIKAIRLTLEVIIEFNHQEDLKVTGGSIY